MLFQKVVFWEHKIKLIVSSTLIKKNVLIVNVELFFCRKSIKLYSNFYSSDIIVASPLALKRVSIFFKRQFFIRLCFLYLCPAAVHYSYSGMTYYPFGQELYVLLKSIRKLLGYWGYDPANEMIQQKKNDVSLLGNFLSMAHLPYLPNCSR